MTAGAESVRARLRRRAGELGLDFQQAIQYYAMERFLYRLSQTQWVDRLVVKGAAALRVWDGAVARPTRDIDFWARIDSTPEAVAAAVAECLAADVPDDGLVFADDLVVEQVVMDDQKPTVRRKVRGDLAGARFVLRLDIGLDDAVVPDPSWVNYPVLLAGPVPRVLAYRPSTAVAEKFEAMVNLGLVNSRLKDFYDVWMLATSLSFAGQELADALRATFTKRSTPIPVLPPAALTPEYYEQEVTGQMWSVFRAKLGTCGVEGPGTLEAVVGAITMFVMPPAAAAAAGRPFDQVWFPGRGWECAWARSL